MGEENKTMRVLITNTIRGIIKTSNEEGIKKEDIVSLLKDNNQYVLVYYK